MLRATHDLREAPLFTVAELDAYIRSNCTAAAPSRRLDGAGDAIDRIVFHFAFADNGRAVGNGSASYTFALRSLWFEHGGSKAWIEATLANGTTRSAELPSTLLDGQWPGTFTWHDGAALRGNV
ncbi:MAG: hypothetical protein Q6365_023595, partial [Candidatus Sigynarchaeota archaeon]